MLAANNISLQFGKRILFDEVNIKFVNGNCYGVIGANGAGKSTFLKILTGEIEANAGHISLEPGKRISFLKQNHFEYNEVTALDTVMMGHEKLWEIRTKKDALYAKPNFSEADGLQAADLETEYGEMDGYTLESEAAALLSGLGITEDKHYNMVETLTGSEKVRVLLSQALFGNPDVLILDEPTNDLDIKTVVWLENFLLDFKNTVIVVSHDRHFLDTVTTHTVDVDFSKVKLFSGNYTFWYESSQLALAQRKSANKKAEDRKKELQNFIAKFSANAAKSKQATSRKKILDKINIDDIQPSSRKYPAIIFEQAREAGDQILEVKNLSKSIDGKILFDNVDFFVNKGDKIALLCDNSTVTTVFYNILNGEVAPDGGSFKFGQTITKALLPNENEHFFDTDLSLIDWLRQFTTEKDEVYIRGFLGKMLFSGQESLKKANVLSGGEKVRCMLSKMMCTQANFLMLDEPTNHLDLESISALNNALIAYKGSAIFTTHDHAFAQSVANRIIEITPNGILDKLMTFDEYLESEVVQEQKRKMLR